MFPPESKFQLRNILTFSMSTGQKRTYHEKSAKSQQVKRRIVFKPILDNPYTKVVWPDVSDDVNSVADLLCRLLEEVQSYDQSIKIRSKKGHGTKVLNQMAIDKPEILKFLTIGFNCTNEAVEAQARQVDRKDEKDHLDPVVAVFACRSDLSPPLLVNHLPELCAAASFDSEKGNLANPKVPVKLIQLPKGSLAKLSKASGRKNLGLIGLRSNAPGCRMIYEFLEEVKKVDVPWLSNSPGLFPPSIVKLLTSAPIKQKEKK